mmetsp:Transcript_4556/g.3995  ORF Transcript_4556/g.3995 Transcript_4556/m.3995 type:complete len:299 (-) Transcript_4556:858-1754(-)
MSCKFYGSAIGCKWGDSCRFSHANPESVRVCKYYQSGNCIHGSRCRYRHFQSQLPITHSINELSLHQPADNEIDEYLNNEHEDEYEEDDNDTSKARFIWNINNIQYPLLFDGYIRNIVKNKYVTKDIVGLCMDFYLEYDLIVLLKNLQRYSTFRSLTFNIGPFVWFMNISIGYKFDLILETMPQHNDCIKRLEFVCSIFFKEINKKIHQIKVRLNHPHNQQTINSVIHYFNANDIQYFNKFTYVLSISEFKAFDIDNNDITNDYINDDDELTKKCRIWTTTEEEWLKPILLNSINKSK